MQYNIFKFNLFDENYYIQLNLEIYVIYLEIKKIYVFLVILLK
ncbi:hypothetical protein SAMN05421796_1081 [Chryseobacterium piscicola]|uniref:Uncharacterized protein n=1 Tax=Chryseobacterium piscicola TaxID=551459 RepID=A0A1N7NHF0_9FLAO|nr:hypothetical protein SAMN05421796_1081 [Chryseobacterium piscicola]